VIVAGENLQVMTVDFAVVVDVAHQEEEVKVIIAIADAGRSSLR